MSASVGISLHDDGVAEIELRRPHRHNAVDVGLISGLLDALAAAEREGAAALLLRGSGPSFCSGHDVGSTATMAGADVREHLERMQVVSRILRATVPSVAAVHGYALGAGFELALSCDLVVAADDAVFGLPEVPMGLAIGGGSSAVLVRTLGPQRARELVLLGERFGAARARELGLVNETVAATALPDRARALATRLAGQPRQALATAKSVLNAVTDDELEPAYEREVAAMLACGTSAEAAAAATAFRAERGTSGERLR